jgi:hypothetical protein
VVTDLTEPPGDWFPRRPDWQAALLGGGAATKIDDQALLAQVLKTTRLTSEIKTLALTEIPFGLWERKPGCDLGGVPKVSDFSGERSMRWMRNAPPPPPDAPVYMQAPGEALYNLICVNCHGAQADSKGLLAEAIMNMTGGDARVANFRDGLFGGAPAAGANRRRVFGPAAMTAGIEADDLGARYLAWMALGGTEIRIPQTLLNIVAVTKVLGQGREGRFLAEGSPNMLQLAQTLCAEALGVNGGGIDDFFLRNGRIDFEKTPLIDKNADAELWQRLCSAGQPPVVRVGTMISREPRIFRTDLYWADAYPAGADALDHEGRVVKGVRPDNLFPACFKMPTLPADRAFVTEYLKERPVRGPGGPTMPVCPPELFSPDDAKWRLKSIRSDGVDIEVDRRSWALRGAVNAGLAIFAYLDQTRTSAVSKAKPAYNRCEDLRR